MSFGGGWCLFGLEARCVAFTARKLSVTLGTARNGPVTARNGTFFPKTKAHEGGVLWNNTATYKKFLVHTQLPGTLMGDGSFLYWRTSSTNMPKSRLERLGTATAFLLAEVN